MNRGFRARALWLFDWYLRLDWLGRTIAGLGLGTGMVGFVATFAATVSQGMSALLAIFFALLASIFVGLLTLIVMEITGTRIPPRHIHHHSATVQLAGVEAKAQVGSFATPRRLATQRRLNPDEAKYGPYFLPEPEAAPLLPIRDAAQIVYDETRHSAISALARNRDGDPILRIGNTVLHQVPAVFGSVKGSTKRDRVSHDEKKSMILLDDGKSAGYMSGAPLLFDIHVNQSDLQTVIDFIKRMDDPGI